MQQNNIGVTNVARRRKPHGPQTAIVLVAFGTTKRDALKTYASIDNAYRNYFPRHEIRWAFTSGMVRRSLIAHDTFVDSPQEAARRLTRDGYSRAVFQSLHVVPGQEFEKILSIRQPGIRITTGRPLLDTLEDISFISKSLLWDTLPDEVTVFVAHGNKRIPRFNKELVQLQKMMQRRKSNAILCTVEGDCPGASGLKEARSMAVQTGSVTFIPLMLVAGIHVADDIMGEAPDSWSRIVGAKKTVLAPPLGVRPKIQELYLKHTRDALIGRTRRRYRGYGGAFKRGLKAIP